MDSLRNYPEFRQDIEFAFKDLIEIFNLILTNPFEGCYLLIGEKCKIKFSYDRGDVFCCFLQISDSNYNSGYNISEVYRRLYPFRVVEKGNLHRLFDPKEQISAFAGFIKDNLTNVLDGDFTWLKEFNVGESGESKLSLFLLDNFDKSSPIFRKFWSGDMSWQKDLENYLMKKTILFYS